MTNIQKQLFALQDKKYREFHSKLIPTIDKQTIIGVRVPVLRKFAQELDEQTAATFLQKLPHQYYEENQLHAILLSGLKDYGQCLAAVNKFLPYVNNWATCDLLRPKIFVKYHKELIKEISVWLQSDKTYTMRFGIEMLLVHFLDKDFQKKYLDWVAKIQSEEYYVRMMQAWFFAEAAAKQYEAVLPYFEKQKLESWTHNKAIQKARESFRVAEDRKEYLRKLKY
ncbi:MAG: DNA alkylation repair protein [Phascolarctobacterium sp.]|nr:DNA alkylation repair protein [Candidatus Phascolarctobacterium caballi]